MFSILLISHGNLAEEMLGAAEMITGKAEGIYTAGLQSGMGVESFGKILEELTEKHASEGLLILADLYGGTPCNTAALKLLPKYENVEMLTGMNLSMVLEAVSMRSGSLKNAMEELAGIGKEDIADMRTKLRDEAALNEADE